MRMVRIIAPMPAGFPVPYAPTSVLSAWKGIELPLAEEEPRVFNFKDEKGQPQAMEAYCVWGNTAISFLEKNDPDAAHWYRLETSYFMPGIILPINMQICQLLD